MSKSKRTDETLTPDLSEDRLTRICEVSTEIGFIEIEEFIAVLTMDENYTDALPQVWKKYCGETKEPKFVTPEQRFRAWQDIFRCEHPQEIFGINESIYEGHAKKLSLRKLVSEKFDLPLPQRLTETDEAGSVFDKVAPLYEKIEELEGKEARTITEVKYKTEKLEELSRELENILEGGEPEAYEPNVQDKRLLSCKPGTSWGDITITLLSNEMVKITTPDGDGKFTYHQLGLQDGRSGDKPTKLWALLQLFAKRTGFLHSENIPQYDPKLSDTAKRLNKHLKNLFGIYESIYWGHYKKEGGYRTKITFEDNTFE